MTTQGGHEPRNSQIRKAIDQARRAQVARHDTDRLEQQLASCRKSLYAMRQSRDGLRDGTTAGWWHAAAKHLHSKGFTYRHLADMFDVHIDTVRYACNPAYQERRKVRARERHLKAVA